MPVQLSIPPGKSHSIAKFPTFVPRRYRPGNLGTWSGHLAFGADLVAALKPIVLVELGTHLGESYFTFCQSVLENEIQCTCYAVDHWRGETHAGYYDEDVFEEIRAYNDSLYCHFSHLLRMSFDEARDQFSDGSINLLHIDGLHTYEAVSHDFRNWYPKVSEGGIVLLHDIAVRHADFGVWRLWDELCVQFPDTFAFHHSWGLGVLRKPGPKRDWNELLEMLFEGSPDAQEELCRRYVIYASHLENEFESERRKNRSLWSHVQLYTSRAGAYSEISSATQPVSFEQPQTLTFILPDGTGDGPLRIDPADCPCVMHIDSLVVTVEESQDVIWRGQGHDFAQLTVGGSALPLTSLDGFALFSYGDDPQIFLPSLPQERRRVKVRMNLRLCRTFEAVAEHLSRISEEALTCRRGETASVQLFIQHEGVYSEESSITEEARIGDWQTLTFCLPYRIGTGSGRLRIDPSDRPCAIEIAAITVKKGGQTVWAAVDSKALQKIEAFNVVLVPGEQKYVLVSPGSDPQLRLPVIPTEGEADSVQITLRLELRPEALIEALSKLADSFTELQSLRHEFETIAAERTLAAAQIAQIATERNNLQREVRELNASVRAKEEARSADYAAIETMKHSIEDLHYQLTVERSIRNGLENSLSWKLTKPVRVLNSFFKKR